MLLRVMTYSLSMIKHPYLKEHKVFKLSDEASLKAHELSLTDWRNWLDYAMPPYDNSYIEINPSTYLKNNDAVNSLAFVCTDGIVDMMMIGDYGGYRIHLYNDEGYDSKDLDESFCKVAWGPSYVEMFGLPSIKVVPTQHIMKMLGKSETMGRRFLEETAGQVRVGLASLALINMHPIGPVTPPKRDGRRRDKILKRYIPYYNLTSIDIDTSKVVRREKSIGYKNRPRKPIIEHDVRGHWRHYKDGRKVWIKSHRRGDSTIGKKMVDNYNIIS